MKWATILLCLFGLLALSACGGGGINAPEVTIPSDLDQQVGEAATRAAGAAATAAAMAGDADQVVATAAEAAATMAAQSDGAVATAQAAATTELAQINLDALMERVASVQPDGNGNVMVTITDGEINQALTLYQATLLEQGQLVRLQNAQIRFTNGNIVLTGEISQPVSGTLTVIARPFVVDGALQFEIIEASFGQMRVPQAALSAAESTLNDTLGQIVSNLPAGVTLQNVIVGEGTLTIVGQTGQ